MEFAVDVIDPAPLVGDALGLLAAPTGKAFRIRERVQSWMYYDIESAFSTDVVVLRGELRDHVPAALKVRALTRLQVRTVVLLDKERAAARRRLLSEGAAAVLASDVSLTNLKTVIERAAQLAEPAPASAMSPELTDREMQIACLFAGRASPTTQHIGELLNLSPETVRRHLQRARLALRRAQFSASSRDELRTSLLESGLLFPDS